MVGVEPTCFNMAPSARVEPALSVLETDTFTIMLQGQKFLELPVGYDPTTYRWQRKVLPLN
jgi:hypothetical protein